MLIKSADDKNSRVKLLEDLQNKPLNEQQRKWVNEQLWALKTGIQGEKDAAFYINSVYKDEKSSVIFHDLRIELDDEVAQIDHLVITPVFAVLFETKSFNGNLIINEYGEFSIRYAKGKEIGIPSPIEQSKRHERVLKKLFEILDIKTYLNQEFLFRHVVLLSPKSIIRRPDSQKFDTFSVIKADSLAKWREEFRANTATVISLMGGLFRKPQLLLKSDKAFDEVLHKNILKTAERILPYHTPEPVSALPPFMQNIDEAISEPPKQAENDSPICAVCRQKVTPAVARFCQAHSERFRGQIYCRTHQQQAVSAKPVATVQIEKTESVSECAGETGGQYCEYKDCRRPLTGAVVNYCRSNADWFGGKLYCMGHQKMIAAARKKNGAKG
ncbi:NERD nuclease [Neisseria chenwenguii]|uniref:NERD nuclease n=1 Tax=Neisseria chenwenguii TaxID=1853278 RepID=A0A220S4Z7_9NEIS|nr:nuclease-related domain-containing protein [Neisseria chenwenguii]ASK28285.1 NERD nuclease [Neisseria chenwenguii]